MELTLTTDVDAVEKKYSEEKDTTAAARYQQLCTTRDPYLQRARDCAKVTIPSLMTEVNQGDHGRLKTPYQSVGARGLGNLSTKLELSLFPPNSPFFKLEIDSLLLHGEDVDPAMKTELDTALVKVELAVMSMLETMSARASMHEAFKQLIVAGNVLLYVNPNGIRVIHLDRYCVVRDPMGSITEIIIEEEVYPEALPEGFLPDDETVQEQGGPTKKSIKIHTCVHYENDKCYWYQEAKGKQIAGTSGMCPADCSPFIALRWERIDAEEYGRSYIEQWYGDLTALESLYQSVLEASAAMSKVLFMVNPNGTTRPRTLSNAANGAIVQGSANDVTVLQSQGKLNDLQLASSTIERIESRLSFAFLLNTAVQRAGERVTAEEIRYMAQELETSIGGLYSILTQELQLPLVRRLMYILQKQRKIPSMPMSEKTGDAMVNPKPVTGLEAIGRGDDRNKLVDFIGTAQQALGPEIMMKYLNMEEALRRLAASASIDTTNLVKTSQQLQQEAQAQAEAENRQQQMEQMSALMNSPAAAQAVKNYTAEGAPYGPQYSAGVDPSAEGTQPNVLPDADAAAEGIPSGNTGGGEVPAA